MSERVNPPPPPNVATTRQSPPIPPRPVAPPPTAVNTPSMTARTPVPCHLSPVFSALLFCKGCQHDIAHLGNLSLLWLGPCAAGNYRSRRRAGGSKLAPGAIVSTAEGRCRCSVSRAGVWKALDGQTANACCFSRRSGTADTAVAPGEAHARHENQRAARRRSTRRSPSVPARRRPTPGTGARNGWLARCWLFLKRAVQQWAIPAFRTQATETVGMADPMWSQRTGVL